MKRVTLTNEQYDVVLKMLYARLKEARENWAPAVKDTRALVQSFEESESIASVPKNRRIIEVCVSCDRQIGHSLNCPQLK